MRTQHSTSLTMVDGLASKIHLGAAELLGNKGVWLWSN